MCALGEEPIEVVASRMNAELPDAIRVLAARRTTRGFDAHKLCDSREYDYLLPAQIPLLNPAKTRDFKFEIFRTTRASRDTRADTSHFAELVSQRDARAACTVARREGRGVGRDLLLEHRDQ
ncbi:hypothetical protein T492DRAFT_508701 [Pavlovales sp. CCMP2436]|nr:hypothetical protein T492DRAFT_508701 [Pavlovales sp. CCMP2436]